jgi:hypothetical protein
MVRRHAFGMKVDRQLPNTGPPSVLLLSHLILFVSLSLSLLSAGIIIHCIKEFVPTLIGRNLPY